MKIKIIESAGTSYFKGDIVDVDKPMGKLLIQEGKAEALTPVLPTGIPARELLLEAGLESIEDVRGFRNLTKIKGIGDKTAQDIVEFLAEFEGI